MFSHLPDFNKKPDLTFFSSTNSGSISAVLNVPNNVGMVNRGVTQYLYGTNDLTGVPVGQRITNDLTYTAPDGTSIGERFVSFYFKYEQMEGYLTILSVRDVEYGSDPYININRIVSGGGDFTFSQGNIVRLYYPNTNNYQYAVYFTN